MLEFRKRIELQKFVALLLHIAWQISLKVLVNQCYFLLSWFEVDLAVTSVFYLCMTSTIRILAKLFVIIQIWYLNISSALKPNHYNKNLLILRPWSLYCTARFRRFLSPNLDHRMIMHTVNKLINNIIQAKSNDIIRHLELHKINVIF